MTGVEGQGLLRRVGILVPPDNRRLEVVLLSVDARRSGCVLDQEGKAVSFAEVEIYAERGGRTATVWADVCGRFSFTLPDDSMGPFTARLTGHTRYFDAGEERFAPLGLAGASPIPRSPDNLLLIEAHGIANGPVATRVRVLDPSGRPAAGAVVCCVQEGAVATVRCDEGGWAHVQRIGEDDLEIWARPQRYERAQYGWQGSLPAVVRPGAEGPVLLRLRVLVALHGVILRDDGQPAAYARVAAFFAGGAKLGEARAAANGQFSLEFDPDVVRRAAVIRIEAEELEGGAQGEAVWEPSQGQQVRIHVR